MAKTKQKHVSLPAAPPPPPTVVYTLPDEISLPGGYDVSGLHVYSNPYEIRRDLHVFVHYVQEHQVKRSHRENCLSKADTTRLAKLLACPEIIQAAKEDGGANWLDHIDWLALHLGFVHYDTKGIYAGYTSYEPSYPDNYIQFQPDAYTKFLKLSPAGQERRLLDSLVNSSNGCASEFFNTSVLGQLSSFSSHGCATAVVPTLDFPDIRRFLLRLLATCQVGVWYSTNALIQHLKTHYPYFLIPEQPQYQHPHEKERGRYANFHESQNAWGNEMDIPEQEPDAFERVEGRYVERFLEGIPLSLGYVDVAYNPRPCYDLYPSIHQLQAFRVNSRLRCALQGQFPAVRVTVQPNFEVYVESEFYPISVLAQLQPLAETVSEGITTILRLDKTRIATQVAQNEALDVIAMLKGMASHELPANVVRELSEWGAHSDKFSLYEGFALLEGDEDLPAAKDYTVERIAPTLRIVHSPGALFERLEKEALAPLSVHHLDVSFSRLPIKTRTRFVQEMPADQVKPKAKENLSLKRYTTVVLHFPAGEPLERVRQALLERRCPVEVHPTHLTLTFSARYQEQVNAALQALHDDYIVSIEDIDG